MGWCREASSRMVIRRILLAPMARRKRRLRGRDSQSCQLGDLTKQFRRKSETPVEPFLGAVIVSSNFFPPVFFYDPKS